MSVNKVLNLRGIIKTEYTRNFILKNHATPNILLWGCYDISTQPVTQERYIDYTYFLKLLVRPRFAWLCKHLSGCKGPTRTITTQNKRYHKLILNVNYFFEFFVIFMGRNKLLTPADPLHGFRLHLFF